MSRNTRFDEASGGVFGGANVLTHRVSRRGGQPPGPPCHRGDPRARARDPQGREGHQGGGDRDQATLARPEPLPGDTPGGWRADVAGDAADRREAGAGRDLGCQDSLEQDAPGREPEDVSEHPVTLPVVKVTVLEDRALVERRGEVTIPAGPSGCASRASRRSRSIARSRSPCPEATSSGRASAASGRSSPRRACASTARSWAPRRGARAG